MESGEIIKFLRRRAGLTQEQFASVLGLTKASVQKYEAGAVPNLKLQTLRTLCEEFNLSPFVLVFPEKVPDFETALRFRMPAADAERLLSLNEEGIAKVLSYAADLYASGNYKK